MIDVAVMVAKIAKITKGEVPPTEGGLPPASKRQIDKHRANRERSAPH